MDKDIEAAIYKEIGGDHQRISDRSTHHDRVTWKHIMLPMWIASFRLGKVYRFAVNARTGEVSGERPYSALKIVSAVFFALTVLILIWRWPDVQRLLAR